MRSLITLSLLAALALATTGCVSQVEIDRLNKQYRQAQERIIELEARLEDKDAQIQALRDSRDGQDADLLARLTAAEAKRAELDAALAQAQAQINELLNRPTAIALPQQLDSALKQLANAHPDLMTYDAALGMVKFRSDLTFDLGSATVKAQAAATLTQLARIFKSGDATGYEARIVGHTDNVPIRNAATLAAHPTNWHLSVHRAIAVKDVLEREGVAPVRMNVSGYGEYRPIVANGQGGAEANRRVEIYLVPSTATAPAASNTGSGTGASSQAPATDAAPANTGTSTTNPSAVDDTMDLDLNK